MSVFLSWVLLIFLLVFHWFPLVSVSFGFGSSNMARVGWFRNLYELQTSGGVVFGFQAILEERWMCWVFCLEVSQADVDVHCLFMSILRLFMAGDFCVFSFAQKTETVQTTCLSHFSIYVFLEHVSIRINIMQILRH